jgi:hypothetical protein
MYYIVTRVRMALEEGLDWVLYVLTTLAMLRTERLRVRIPVRSYDLFS